MRIRDLKIVFFMMKSYSDIVRTGVGHKRWWRSRCKKVFSSDQVLPVTHHLQSKKGHAHKSFGATEVKTNRIRKRAFKQDVLKQIVIQTLRRFFVIEGVTENFF